MTVKEKSHNYLWSRIQNTERELVKLQSEMCSRGQNRISLSTLEKMYESTENKLSMYNYLFKLVELDEE
jgi:hypothetical protein